MSLDPKEEPPHPSRPVSERSLSGSKDPSQFFRPSHNLVVVFQVYLPFRRDSLKTDPSLKPPFRFYNTTIDTCRKV